MNKSDSLSAAILTETDQYLDYTSYYPLSKAEYNDPEIKSKMETFTAKLNDSLSRRGKDGLVYPEEPSLEGTDQATPEPEPYEPVHPWDEPSEEVKDDLEIKEADDIDHEAFNKLLSARVHIPQGDSMNYGTVRRRKRDDNGDLIGRSNDNPFMDTAVYEVEMDSGEFEEYTANIIAENIYAQIDGDGYTTYMLDEIVDHKYTDEALRLDDAIEYKHNQQVHRKTTKGWKICVR